MESIELQERVDRLRHLFITAIDMFGRDAFLLAVGCTPREFIEARLAEPDGIELLRAALLLAYGDAVLAEMAEHCEAPVLGS